MVEAQALCETEKVWNVWKYEKKGKGARVEELRKLWPLWFVTFHVCAFGIGLQLVN